MNKPSNTPNTTLHDDGSPSTDTPEPDSAEVETQRTFTYTDQEIFTWVEGMAEALKRHGLHWLSMKTFFEKSRDNCHESGQHIEWAMLFDPLSMAFRSLAAASAAESLAWRKERERPDSEDCRAGVCHHEQRSETVAVTFTACEGFWDDADKYLDGVPVPVPTEITLPGYMITATLPLLFKFAGVPGPRAAEEGQG